MIVGKSVGGIKGYEKKVYIKNGWILGERVVGLRYFNLRTSIYRQ
jgi:hypothetical protein